MTGVLIRPVTWADQSWQRDAACAGTGLGLWFTPERGDADPVTKKARDRRAKAICHTCPVLATCDEWGDAIDEKWATLGGITAEERRRRRRNRGRRVPR